jgi:DNA-directed RNA polymerase omega subunit
MHVYKPHFNEHTDPRTHKEGEQMSENQSKIGPGEISRFRAVVVAALRAKQLRRGSKPRFEQDDKKHKDTSIAMEEVRRGLVTFTQFAVPHVHYPGAMRDLKAGMEQSLPVVG